MITMQHPQIKPWRTEVNSNDLQAVNHLIAATGFFSSQEQDIAVELVDEAINKGDDSGYFFVFADATKNTHDLMGYSCYGPIPETASSFDLYWLAVSPNYQQQGLGRQLLLMTESLAVSAGATELIVETSGKPLYQPTREFYLAMGYKVINVIEDFYAAGDAKLIYKKHI